MILRCATFILLTVCLSANAAKAAVDPGEWISEDAVAVVRLKNPKATAAKVETFLNGTLQGNYKTFLGDQPLIVRLESLIPDTIDWERDIWLGLFFVNNEQNPGTSPIAPFIVVPLIAPAQGEEFRKANPSLHCHVHESTLVCTLDAGVIESFKKCIAGEGKSFLSVRSPEEKNRFEGNDLSAMVSLVQARKKIGGWVGVVPDDRDELLFDLAMLNFELLDRVEIPGSEVIDAVFQEFIVNSFDHSESIFTIEMLRDCQVAVAGLTIAEEGISIDADVQFNRESPTIARFQKPSKLAFLNSLPQNQHIYIAATSFAKYTSPLSPLPFAESDLNQTEDRVVQAEYQTTASRLEKLIGKEGATAASYPTGDPTTGYSFSSIRRVDNSPTHRRLLLHLAATESTSKKFTQTKSYVLQEQSEEYETDTGDVHLINFKDQAQETRFYGPKGFEMRSLYRDNIWVNTIGGGKQAMQGVIGRLKNPEAVTTDAGFQATRSRLPERANFLIITDFAGLQSALLHTFATEMEDKNGRDEALLNVLQKLAVRPDRSYLGISGGIEDGQARLKLFLPTKQAESLVSAFFCMMSGNFEF